MNVSLTVEAAIVLNAAITKNRFQRRLDFFLLRLSASKRKKSENSRKSRNDSALFFYGKAVKNYLTVTRKKIPTVLIAAFERSPRLPYSGNKNYRIFCLIGSFHKITLSDVIYLIQ